MKKEIEDKMHVYVVEKIMVTKKDILFFFSLYILKLFP